MPDRYIENKTLTSEGGRKYRINSIYPDIPATANDTYIITTGGDRYDTLAQQYYGDSDLWWVIANANGNLDKGSLTPPLGTQLRIPANPTPTLATYNNINPQTTVTNNTAGNNGY